MDQKTELIYLAQSIIERDALIQYLADHSIDAFSPSRDISRKFTENTVDLAFEGYSAIFDGFKIFVSPGQKEDALNLLKEFQSTHQEFSSLTEKSSFQTFSYCSIFSMILPFLMHFYGAINLAKAFRKKERIRVVRLVASLALYIFTLFVYGFLVKNWLEKLISSDSLF